MTEKIEKADVIVLEADGTIDSEGHGYSLPILNRLAALEYKGARISLPEMAGVLSDLPKKPMIISGGMTEVTADVDWIVESKEFLRGVIAENQGLGREERTPMLGICFGAQLIAETWHQGNVQYLDTPEIGASRITLGQADHRLFEGFETQFDAYSFHYNQIKPQKLSVISSHQLGNSDFVQAFEIKDAAALGVQFHPEFKHEEMKKLLANYRNLIAELGFDLGPIIERLPRLTGNWLLLDNFIRNYRKE